MAQFRSAFAFILVRPMYEIDDKYCLAINWNFSGADEYDFIFFGIDATEGGTIGWACRKCDSCIPLRKLQIERLWCAKLLALSLLPFSNEHCINPMQVSALVLVFHVFDNACHRMVCIAWLEIWFDLVYIYSINLTVKIMRWHWRLVRKQLAANLMTTLLLIAYQRRLLSPLPHPTSYPSKLGLNWINRKANRMCRFRQQRRRRLEKIPNEFQIGAVSGNSKLKFITFHRISITWLYR